MKYFIVMVLFLLPVILLYERQKPRAREVVLLSLLTAFTVFLNMLCAATIPLHAGTTAVVLSGIALGPGAGFIVGVCARFVCNLFAGQGPWTVWQMLSWSMLGLFAGAAFCKDDIQLNSTIVENKEGISEKIGKSGAVFIPMAGVFAGWLMGYLEYLFTTAGAESFFGYRLYLYGGIGLAAGVILSGRKLPTNAITVTMFTFFMTFIVYGGVMNFAAMLMQQGSGGADAVSAGTLRALYITGVPYDLSHAGGAAVCAYIMGEPFLRRMKRIKIKYLWQKSFRMEDVK